MKYRFKIILKVVLVVGILSNVAYALPGFRLKARLTKKYLQNKNSCKKCDKLIVNKDSSYCSHCGYVFCSSIPVTVKCPYCYLHFSIYPDETLKTCDQCKTRLSPDANFCEKCGIKLFYDIYFIECSRCRKGFEMSIPEDSKRQNDCRSCKRNYSSQYSKCPYCYSYSRKRSYYKNKERTYDKHRNNYNDEHDKKSFSKGEVKILKSINIGSFTKHDYKKEIKKYNVGGYTQVRPYSKLIIDVSKRGKYTPIVNTIKVFDNGKWIPYGQGVRLQQGKNNFEVSIPKGTTEIVVSFDHGKDSKIDLYID